MSTHDTHSFQSDAVSVEAGHSHTRSGDHHEPVFVVYTRRWWMLVVFSALGMLNNVVCYSFAPIYALAHDHYGADVDLDSMVTSFFISYVIFSFPSSWIISRFGLRTGVVLGGWLQALGCWMRVAHYYVSPDTFPMLMSGQVIASLGQSFFVNPPPLLASAWFADDERTLATTVSVNANTLGIAVVFFIAPVLVSTSRDIPHYLEWIAIVSLAFAVMAASTFQSEPPTPPSKSAHDKTPMGLAQIDTATAIDSAAVTPEQTERQSSSTAIIQAHPSLHYHPHHSGHHHHHAIATTSVPIGAPPPTANTAPHAHANAGLDAPAMHRTTSEPSAASLAALSAALGPESADSKASVAVDGVAVAPEKPSTAAPAAAAATNTAGATAAAGAVSVPIPPGTPSPTLSASSQEVLAITGGANSHPRTGVMISRSGRVTPPLGATSNSFRLTARTINKATFSMSGTLSVYLGLLKQPGFLHTVIAFAIAEACINGFSAFLNPLLVPLGYDIGFIGNLGSAFIVSCMVGSSLFSFIVDRTKTYQSAILFALSMSVLMTAYFIFVLHHFAHGTRALSIHVTLSLLLGGFFIGPIQPLAIEVAAECTYPVPESYATAVQQVIGNLFSAAMFPIMMYTRDRTSPNPYLKGVWFLTGGLFLTTIIYLSWNGQYKRLNTEREHEHKRKQRMLQRAAARAAANAANTNTATTAAATAATGAPAANGGTASSSVSTANATAGATERDRLLVAAPVAGGASYNALARDELP